MLCPTVDEALAQLCVQLMQREPSARPKDAEIIAALGSPLMAAAAPLPLLRTRPLFVGRQRELTLLRESLEEVPAGRAATLLLAGPSGIGKSALLDEFLTSLSDDMLILRGRCHEREAVPRHERMPLLSLRAAQLVHALPGFASTVRLASPAPA